MKPRLRIVACSIGLTLVLPLAAHALPLKPTCPGVSDGAYLVPTQAGAGRLDLLDDQGVVAQRYHALGDWCPSLDGDHDRVTGIVTGGPSGEVVEGFFGVAELGDGTVHCSAPDGAESIEEGAVTIRLGFDGDLERASSVSFSCGSHLVGWLSVLHGAPHVAIEAP